MSSGSTELQRSSHSAASRARPRSASSSIEIASSLAPVIRITCSSFGQRSRIAADLLELLVVLDDHRAGVGVLEHVLALLGRVRLVDRDDRGAGGEGGEVEVGPLGAGVGEDRDLVAALDAEIDQAERELADGLADLRVGALHPGAALVLEHDRRRGRRSARRRSEAGRRSSSSAFLRPSRLAAVADSIALLSITAGRCRRNLTRSGPGSGTVRVELRRLLPVPGAASARR